MRFDKKIRTLALISFLNKIFSKSRSTKNGIFFDALKKVLAFEPINLEHYQRAFTHRSMNMTDADGNPFSYERLEFLGDAMISSIVAAHLFEKVPNGDEGYLTQMRSKIVSRDHLNTIGKNLDLISFLESKTTSQHFGENIYGNIFEALIGAIYLDKGYPTCEKFIQKTIVKPYINIAKLEGKVISYKSLMIEWCQKEKKIFRFESYEDNGIKGERYFGVKLYIENKLISKTRAISKKKAEEKAAQRAYFAFQNKIDTK